MGDGGQPAARAPFDLVVAVASLGGLPVISALVEGLPATFPAPLLILQHGRRGAEPHRLAWLLQRRTELPVRAAATGLPAFTRGITVIPGGFTAVVTQDGLLSLSQSDELGGDTLMATAAAAAPGRAIGVILSGMLRDGSEGARAIKRHGGWNLAQDPATARAPAMPSSAMATGCVDFVLPPHRLATALVALVMAPGAAELLTVPLPHWARTGA